MHGPEINGPLNKYCFCYVVGAFGLTWFYVQISSPWVKSIMLVCQWIPFVLLFFVTLPAYWPFSDRLFSCILCAAMLQYLLMVICAESLLLFGMLLTRPERIILARISVYFGFAAFIPSAVVIRRLVSRRKRE